MAQEALREPGAVPARRSLARVIGLFNPGERLLWSLWNISGIERGVVKAAADENPLKYSLGRLFSCPTSMPVTITHSLIHPAHSRLLSCAWAWIRRPKSIRPILAHTELTIWPRSAKTNKTPSYTDPCSNRDTHRLFKMLGKQMTLSKEGLMRYTKEVTPASCYKGQVYKGALSRNGMGTNLWGEPQMNMACVTEASRTTGW